VSLRMNEENEEPERAGWGRDEDWLDVSWAVGRGCCSELTPCCQLRTDDGNE
jgi:hypothetical protein